MSDDEGRNIGRDPKADVIAAEALEVPEGTPVAWYIPDVFSVAYCSCYAATARTKDRAVRFTFCNDDNQLGFDEDKEFLAAPFKPN